MGPDPRRPRIVILCGPTAAGKTAAAVAAAERFGGEIVGADSMQIYRYMDIGTAKPTPAERARVPHHLIDVADPDEPFDAARYADTAGAVIAGLHGRAVLPLVVGGTGLYIKALTRGLFEAAPVDGGVRRRLREEIRHRGNDALHRRLTRLDPEAAGRLHPNDTHRILRALEVIETTGRPITRHHRDHAFSGAPYETLTIGLALPREDLYRRIDHRVDAMIDAGFLSEVAGLLERGYGPDLKSMNAIGYRHLADHLLNRTDWAETVRTLKRDTRRYAKRQMTWFGRDTEIHWHRPDDLAGIVGRVERYLGRGKG